jgi:hypothetical protein
VIGGLAAHGAQNLLVLNVPDIGKTPEEIAHGPAVAQSASALSSLYDSELAAALQPLEASGALKIDLVDTFSVVNRVNANPWRLRLLGCDRSGVDREISPIPAVVACARRVRRKEPVPPIASTRCIRPPRRTRFWHPGIAQRA